MRKLAITTVAVASYAWAIEPGNWEATSRMTDIQLPSDLPPQAADMMRNILGGEGITAQNCVTQEDLDNSPERIFEDTNGECRYTEFEMAGGEIHAVAQCNSDLDMNVKQRMNNSENEYFAQFPASKSSAIRRLWS